MEGYPTFVVDLDAATVRRVTADALARHPELSGRFVALAVGAADPLADVARTVERQVFEESFGNDTATMVAESWRCCPTTAAARRSW